MLISHFFEKFAILWCSKNYFYVTLNISIYVQLRDLEKNMEMIFVKKSFDRKSIVKKVLFKENSYRKETILIYGQVWSQLSLNRNWWSLFQIPFLRLFKVSYHFSTNFINFTNSTFPQNTINSAFQELGWSIADKPNNNCAAWSIIILNPTRLESCEFILIWR